MTDKEILDLQELAVKQAQVSHAALDKAKSELDRIEAEKLAYAAMVPKAAEALMHHRRTAPDQTLEHIKQALLSSPAVALEILIKAADPRVMGDGPPPIGKPTEKTASEKRDAFQPFDARGRETQADRNYEQRVMGLLGNK